MENKNEQQLKKKKSKKLYIIIPILILIFVGFGVYNYYNNLKDYENFGNKVCATIKATPSWVNKQGVIDIGYTNFNNTNPKEIVDLLINAEIYLAYHSDCGACKSQIAYFNSEWERYVNSGYTIDCKYS